MIIGYKDEVFWIEGKGVIPLNELMKMIAETFRIKIKVEPKKK